MGEGDRRPFAGRKMALDLACEVMGVHHGARHTHPRQPVEGMVEQGLARDLHERLRPLEAERAHPHREAGGHHHGGLGDGGHDLALFPCGWAIAYGTSRPRLPFVTPAEAGVQGNQ